ncbi:MAG: helix-turn-helix transcriptional regulator, partial [Chloroflexota bacterium]
LDGTYERINFGRLSELRDLGFFLPEDELAETTLWSPLFYRYLVDNGIIDDESDKQKVGIVTDTGESLTSKEEEVFRLLIAGCKAKEAAERLNVSPNTIKTHIQNIYSKFNVGSQAKLMARVNKLNPKGLTDS